MTRQTENLLAAAVAIANWSKDDEEITGPWDQLDQAILAVQFVDLLDLLKEEGSSTTQK